MGWCARISLRILQERLQKMAAMGYETVEMCPPVGYSRFGFGAFAEYSAAELRRIIMDAGLTCMSSHDTALELREDLPVRIEFAQQLGVDPDGFSPYISPR